METLSYCQLMQRCGELEVQLADVVAENADLKSVVGECQGYFIAGIRNTIRPTNEGYLHMRCDTVADETPATDAWQREQMAKGVDALAQRLEGLVAVSVTQGFIQQFAAKLRNGEAV